MAMERREYRVTFLTPAFLGDAEQKGRWRTPPFKALLRQWWRVVKAPEVGYDYRTLRVLEGQLFGDASEAFSMRSRVRLTLSDWRSGSASKLPNTGLVCHPEVNHTKMPYCPDGKPGRMVGADLYLGYGPIGPKGLTHPPAIAAGDGNALCTSFPAHAMSELTDALQLIHWFGAVGGRSRNGWGSLALDGEGVETSGALLDSGVGLQRFTRDLKECLALDWPHALGRDDRGPLVWKTEHQESWSEVMKRLAEVKIRFRTAVPFGPKGDFGDRHVLAYPVTHHSTAWGGQKRLANPLRFKVVHSGDRHIGVAYHLPCAIPATLKQPGVPNASRQLTVWQKVHDVLDKTLTRLGGSGQ
jgi:CRISPR-associated protein Cmr1